MLVYSKLKSVKYKARIVSVCRAYGLCKLLFLLTIDITQWYLVGLGLVALFITTFLLLKTIKFARTYATFFL